MKSIARCVPILLLFMLASTASWANQVVVGSLDLFNTIPGTSEAPGADTLFLTNVTGSGATNVPDQSLAFSNVQLTIDGVNQTSNLTADPSGLFDYLDNIAQDSITSFSLTATLSSPFITVNGQQEQIDPMVSLNYSGPALDTSTGASPHFDLTATSVPESSGAAMLGASLLAMFGGSLWSLRRYRAQE